MKVKSVLMFFLILFSALNLISQNQGNIPEGSVTYITSQNVYVKFNSTAGIKEGDTLFRKEGGNFIPVLKVNALSSISCVCVPLTALELKISDKIFFRRVITSPAVEPETVPLSSVIPPENGQNKESTEKYDTGKIILPNKNNRKQSIHGYLNLSSYTDWSNYSSTNSQREKLTLSLSAKNIDNTNFSAECFISYYQNHNQWNETSKSISNNLKIYNLAASYDFNNKATLIFGRKINPKLSSFGANDGVQFEIRFKPVGVGVIAGFHPNFNDYGFNSGNFQTAAYLFNEYAVKSRFMQTVLAFIDQTNGWKTDRRFLYLQHSNGLIKNLTFYGAAEVDMYGKKINNQDSTYKPVTTAKLSSIYLSLACRIIRKLSLSLSYSARQNVIYYETYKDFLDRVLDTRVLQGYILQVTYNPVNNLSVGATGTYSFQKEDRQRTKNLYAYITYGKIPGINTATTISLVLLGTGYLDGKIYSIALSKDLVSGKLFAGLTYRYVDYKYLGAEYPPTVQNMGELSLTWKIIRKLLVSVYYEGTFEKINHYSRIFAQLSFGF